VRFIVDEFAHQRYNFYHNKIKDILSENCAFLPKKFRKFTIKWHRLRDKTLNQKKFYQKILE